MNVAAVLLVGPRNRRRSCLLALLAAPALVGCKGQPPPPAAPSIGGSAASDGAAQAFLSLLDDAQRAAAWRDRRHRVAAVCAAGAFALLQAADLVLPRLGRRMAVLVLVLEGGVGCE